MTLKAKKKYAYKKSRDCFFLLKMEIKFHRNQKIILIAFSEMLKDFKRFEDLNRNIQIFKSSNSTYKNNRNISVMKFFN